MDAVFIAEKGRQIKMNEEIILYSINCPACIALEKKLIDKKIDFKLCTDVKEISSKSISVLPVLQVGQKFMNFREALQWVKDYEN